MKKQNTNNYIVKMSANQTTLIDRLIKFDKKQSKTTGKQYGNMISVDVEYLASKLFDKKVEKRYIYNLLTELIEKKNVLTRYDKGNSINGINSTYIINYDILLGEEWCADNLTNNNTTVDADTQQNINDISKKSKVKREINNIYENKINNLLTFLNITNDYMIETEFEKYIDDEAKGLIHKVELTQSITSEEYNMLTDPSHYALYVCYYYAKCVADKKVSTYEAFVTTLGEDVLIFEKTRRLQIFIDWTISMQWSAKEMYSLANVIEDASKIMSVDNAEFVANIRFDVARYLPDMNNEDFDTSIKVRRLKNFICSTPYGTLCQLDVKGKRLDEIIAIIGYK